MSTFTNVPEEELDFESDKYCCDEHCGCSESVAAKYEAYLDNLADAARVLLDWAPPSSARDALRRVLEPYEKYREARNAEREEEERRLAERRRAAREQYQKEQEERAKEQEKRRQETEAARSQQMTFDAFIDAVAHLPPGTKIFKTDLYVDVGIDGADYKDVGFIVKSQEGMEADKAALDLAQLRKLFCASSRVWVVFCFWVSGEICPSRWMRLGGVTESGGFRFLKP